MSTQGNESKAHSRMMNDQFNSKTSIPVRPNSTTPNNQQSAGTLVSHYIRQYEDIATNAVKFDVIEILRQSQRATERQRDRETERQRPTGKIDGERENQLIPFGTARATPGMTSLSYKKRMTSSSSMIGWIISVFVKMNE
jgi:hypothetical protein